MEGGRQQQMYHLQSMQHHDTCTGRVLKGKDGGIDGQTDGSTEAPPHDRPQMHECWESSPTNCPRLASVLPFPTFDFSQSIAMLNFFTYLLNQGHTTNTVVPTSLQPSHWGKEKCSPKEQFIHKLPMPMRWKRTRRMLIPPSCLQQQFALCHREEGRPVWKNID